MAIHAGTVQGHVVEPVDAYLALAVLLGRSVDGDENELGLVDAPVDIGGEGEVALLAAKLRGWPAHTHRTPERIGRSVSEYKYVGTRYDNTARQHHAYHPSSTCPMITHTHTHTQVHTIESLRLRGQ